MKKILLAILAFMSIVSIHAFAATTITATSAKKVTIHYMGYKKALILATPLFNGEKMLSEKLKKIKGVMLYDIKSKTKEVKVNALDGTIVK